MSPRRAPPDAVTLALYRGLFTACAEEMGATLMRAAHSPNITERLDHSCAVFDARARLVAQAAHIPVHLGSMPRAVEAALALAPFRPGDAVLLNDPYDGGTHLPDLTCISPVFLEGRPQPSFFVASRAHHADVGGAAPGSLPIRVAIDTHMGHVRADFTGTAPQAAGPVNAVRAVTRAAVLYAVRCVLGEEIAVNDGLLRVIEVVAPPGSLVDPRPPAAVGAGNVETSQRIVDTVLGALARALPDRVPAASSGTMNNLLIGGHDPRTDRAFAYYETLGGGHGGGPAGPGESAMQAHMTNTRNTPIESLEHAYPLHVQHLRVRRGTGGRGLHRGGDGMERAIELLVPARVTVIAERRVLAPYGLAGGEPGAPGSTRITRAVRGKRVRQRDVVMPGKFTIDLAEGALITVASPGGGGWGRATRARRPRRARRGSTPR